MMNLTNMRIGKRLGLGFGIAVVLTLTIAGVGWWGITTVNSAQDEAIAYTNNAVRARAINNDVTDIYLAIWHIATTSDRASQQEYRAALQKSREQYKTRIAEAKANAHTEQGKQRRKPEKAYCYDKIGKVKTHPVRFGANLGIFRLIELD